MSTTVKRIRIVDGVNRGRDGEVVIMSPFECRVDSIDFTVGLVIVVRLEKLGCFHYSCISPVGKGLPFERGNR